MDGEREGGGLILTIPRLTHPAPFQSFQKFQKQLRPMLRERKNNIMLEFAYWDASGPAHLGGIYELRSYVLQGGKLLEWEHEW